MQLGARWAAGSPPHRGVPPELHRAIAEQEAAHPEAGSWTLTWLEGRPRCALDDLVIVTLEGVEQPGRAGPEDLDGADDDWLG
ncbi:Fe-S oxidoreductase [Leucobacter sp. wl10]|uniref:Fe-S oxidoreductase n=1 Tax=Leucobacter sp. wl10 TaxID=2304677 RepID=UPI001F09DF1E|nr:Fe-S oxidoreductase [Leucobacter sp. wl10]